MDSHYPSSSSQSPYSNEPFLQEGEEIGGRFTVQSLLRDDFTGTVYLAQDHQSQRLIECQILHLSSRHAKRLLELRSHIHHIKKLSLKSFATIYGIGKQSSQGYIVRQYAEGRPLTDHLNHRAQLQKPFKQRGLCSLLVELIQALESLQRHDVSLDNHGLIHPQSVLIQNEKSPRVRLTDLGLALIRPELSLNGGGDIWSQGCIPELRGNPTPQVPDLYSLGALLFQMTQLRPFTNHWQRDLIIPSTFPNLADLIEACVSPQPMISLDQLKTELKSAAKVQGTAEQITHDLSQLQQRLQQIIQPNPTPASPSHSSTIPVAPSDALTPDALNNQYDQENEVFSNVPSHQLPSQSQPLQLESEETFNGIFNELPPTQVNMEIDEGELSFQQSHFDNLAFQTPPPSAHSMHQEKETIIAADQSGQHLEDEDHVDPEHQISTSTSLSSVLDESSSQEEATAHELIPPSFDASESTPTSTASLDPHLNSTDIESSPSHAIEPAYVHSPEESSSSTESIPAQSSQDDLMSSANPYEYEEHMSSYTSSEGTEASSGVYLEEIETFHGAELIEDEQNQLQMAIPKPPRPAPSLPPAPKIDYNDPDRQRWLVVRSGMDYGPFTQAELVAQLFSEEINLETELCDIETNERASLGDFEVLETIIHKWGEEYAHRESQRRLLEQKRKVRRKWILAFLTVFILGGSAFGAVYGPALYESMLPKPLVLDFQAWAAEPPQMTQWKHLKESDAVRRERLSQMRKKRLKKEALADARQMALDAKLASTSSMTFGGKRKKVGRSFSQSEFNRTWAKYKTKVENCLDAEMKRSSGKTSFTIKVTVQPSGRLLNTRLVKGSNPSQRCLFRATKGASMRPYDGADRTITLPYSLN